MRKNSCEGEFLKRRIPVKNSCKGEFLRWRILKKKNSCEAFSQYFYLCKMTLTFTVLWNRSIFLLLKDIIGLILVRNLTATSNSCTIAQVP